jgi:hypothetical protein
MDDIGFNNKTSLEDGKREITIKDERQNIISWAIKIVDSQPFVYKSFLFHVHYKNILVCFVNIRQFL